jgi:dTDP-4-dehydrorhamnose 3,5-epimerase
MKVEALAIPDVLLIAPRSFEDARGVFSETWNQRAFAEAGIATAFVQDNHVRSAAVGTLRGLHYQIPPHAQGKLVRVIRGAIFDVAVDLRRQSPTYGRHVGAILSAANTHQIWVPVGFAHGYVTLEPDTEVLYKVTDYYAPGSEGGLLWNDPALGIDWPVDTASVVLSDKDTVLPRLDAVSSPF